MRVEAFALQGQQVLLLDVLEDGQGPLAGGAVDPGTGRLQAPAKDLTLDMLQVQPGLAPKEAFPEIGHSPFDVGLAFGSLALVASMTKPR